MGDRGDLDREAVRRVLTQERETILELSAVSAEGRRPVELDQQSVGRLSRMDALQVQAMAMAVETRRRGRLKLIDPDDSVVPLGLAYSV